MRAMRFSKIHRGPNACLLAACVLSLAGLSACADADLPATATPTVAVATSTNPPATATSTAVAPTATPTPTSSPQARRISGHVSWSVCSSSAMGVSVELQPSGRTTVTSEDGTFSFDGVVDGEYELVFDNPQLTMAVIIAGRDEVVAFCLDCPASLRIEPKSGPVGTMVRVSGGNCYALHSGRPATIFFDDVAVGFFHGSQAGNYDGTIVVPDASLGPHTLRLPPGDLPAGGDIATTQFIVTSH